MTYLADIFSIEAVLMQRVTDLESMLHGALQRIIDLEKRPPCHCDSCKEMRLYQAERPEPVVCEQVEPGGLTVCTLDAGHAGPHEAWGVRDVVATWTDPEPVPEWRRLVDEHSRHVGGDPLYIALDAITTIQRGIDALSTDSRKANLARIVAVCEAQVGDGWQANTSGWDGALVNIHTLLVYASMGDPGWANLGNAAAAWLKSLTEADA